MGDRGKKAPYQKKWGCGHGHNMRCRELHVFKSCKSESKKGGGDVKKKGSKPPANIKGGKRI